VLRRVCVAAGGGWQDAEKKVRQHRRFQKLKKRLAEGLVDDGDEEAEEEEEQEDYLQWDDAQTKSMATKTEGRVKLIIKRNKARVERDLITMEEADDSVESACLIPTLGALIIQLGFNRFNRVITIQ
jgi:hypothetical protein